MRMSLHYNREGRLSQAGFSLIEAMVAMAIFTIGILGCYRMQLQSVHSNAVAERVSTASHWAAYAIEELLDKDYDHADFDDDDGRSGCGRVE